MAANTDTWNPRDDIDRYEYQEQSSRFRHLLWYCAGADIKLLERCPQSERIKKEGIGGIVLATGGLAFISGSYAFYTVFSTGSLNGTDDLNIFAVIKAIIFGFMWAFVIFNLDRFIVSSVSHGDGTSAVTWGELFQSLPRIFMALVIGLCLSKPLEIRVMKSEIEAKLHIDQIDYQDKEKKILETAFEEKKKVNEARLADLEKRQAKLAADLDKKRAEISEQEKIMVEEMRGKVSAGGAGTGANYRAAEKLRDEKARERDFLQTKLDEAKPGIEEEKKRLIADYDKLISEKDENFKIVEKNSQKFDGLIQRITIAEKYYPIPSHILSLLLIIIEVSPIIFKMMLEDGPYDRLVENQKRLTEARYAIEVHKNIDSNSKEVVVGHTNHQAEALSLYEIGNLKVQRELTAHIQGIYMRNTVADMEKNPDKYIERGAGSSTAS
ncbi:MAG: DUF4407 domain-containing protein [Betaproteobacteria bacterium]|nr:DUF4407 domain-containing protein [Betaproteobacteria bacterium]